MTNIVCLLRGHKIIREHSSEPLSHFLCTRCGKRWYDPTADEKGHGYCVSCAAKFADWLESLR